MTSARPGELAAFGAASLAAREAPLRFARGAVASLFFLCGFTGSSWIARIPEVKVALGLHNGALGLALLSSTVGAVLAMPITGLCVARFGSRRVTRLVALATGLLLPWLGFAHSLPSLVIALGAFGAAGGSLGVAMNAQAVAVERQTGRAIMSSFHAAFSVGGLAGAALGGLCAALGVRPQLHLSLVAALAIATVLSVARFLPEGADGARTRSKLRLQLPSRALLVLGVLSLCGMIGEGAIADWSGVYLRSELAAPAGLAAQGYAAFCFAMAAGRALGDTLSERWGPVRLLRRSGLLALLGLMVVLSSQRPSVALFGFACVGIGFSVVVPIVFSAAARVTSVSPAYALSCVTILGYAGFLAGPPSIGFASELLGLRAALGLIVLTSALIALLAGWVQPRTTREG